MLIALVLGTVNPLCASGPGPSLWLEVNSSTLLNDSFLKSVMTMRNFGSPMGPCGLAQLSQWKTSSQYNGLGCTRSVSGHHCYFVIPLSRCPSVHANPPIVPNQYILKHSQMQQRTGDYE